MNNALNKGRRVRRVRRLEAKGGMFVRRAGARFQQTRQREVGEKTHGVRPRPSKHAKIALAGLSPLTDGPKSRQGGKAGPKKRICGVFQADESADIQGHMSTRAQNLKRAFSELTWADCRGGRP